MDCRRQLRSSAPNGAVVARLAEDGTTATISAEFQSSGAGTNEAPLNAIGPNDSPSTPIPLGSYFSYASMIIPSNDAFIGNDTQAFRHPPSCSPKRALPSSI